MNDLYQSNLNAAITLYNEKVRQAKEQEIKDIDQLITFLNDSIEKIPSQLLPDAYHGFAKGIQIIMDNHSKNMIRH